ncbi:Uncharacterized protein YktB, UPF0637 family [Carnobacterium iners]|uniref:UPF0637 protein SAMN04488700_2228 n=1 Tax=Carnobacterium iners TaxID=1073423 RepID=A0A1X7NMX1_9LACT|nr:DUF1054 domain-containing protein [Carnobacterium iners]SEK31341.1 Uncharacterized protein YktB, UPF0637 family [Carnobacterium iners]SMH39303.1 Uncharacterized protein YktB, UPF0637 family [Carnobacterium iners]
MKNVVVFTQEDFDIFAIEGLDSRMNEIRKKIQPKFKKIGTDISKDLSLLLGDETLPVHIAQHLRRTKNPPQDTWCAIGGDKRGYKKYPHFQLGLYHSHLFIWLAFIDNPQFEKEMAQSFIDNKTVIQSLPSDFVVSYDHTKENVQSIDESELRKNLIRWRDSKKGEFLVGRRLSAANPIFKDSEAFYTFVLETYKSLVPIYKQAFQAYPN